MGLCCSCNIFPKIQKNLGPSFSFILLSSLDLFDFCSRLAFMLAMFHGIILIFPCHRKCFRLLSWESSYLHTHHCGKEQNIKSESNVFGLRCIFYFSVAVLRSRRNVCLYVFHCCGEGIAKLPDGCIFFFRFPPF